MFEPFNNIEDDNRFVFPGRIARVTGDTGGEAIAIAGADKTAVLDTGMAYCQKETIDNLKKQLKEWGFENQLDYVILSHSHYDHIGALPYVKKAFPDVEVCGSAYCAKILPRPGARALIKELGEAARSDYRPDSTEEIITDNLEVTRILEDGDTVDLGDGVVIKAIETKGHTNCSMSFYIEKYEILFTSESTGILQGADPPDTSFLKSFVDALASVEKCRAYDPKVLVLPHYGRVADEHLPDFWDMVIEESYRKKELVESWLEKGYDEDQMLDKYFEIYWTEDRAKEQPLDAFSINSRNTIKTIVKWIEEGI